MVGRRVGSCLKQEIKEKCKVGWAVMRMGRGWGERGGGHYLLPIRAVDWTLIGPCSG